MDLDWCARPCGDVIQWIYHQVNTTNDANDLLKKDVRVERTFACHSLSPVADLNNSTIGPCSNRQKDHVSYNILNLMSTWQDKHPEEWDNPDILNWIYFTAGLNDIQLSALRGENFQGLVGRQFCKMSREDFVKRDPEFGEVLYNSFVSLSGLTFDPVQNDAADEPRSLSSPEKTLFWSESFPISHGSLIPATVQMSEMQDFSDDDDINIKQDQKPKGLGLQSNKKKWRKTDDFSKSSSDDSTQHDVTHDNLNIGKRKHSSKILLSNFMRDLLESPEYNPSCVRWEDKGKGIFRIISGKSKFVAELWGKIKNNPKMTFEKMGRSLRWCRDNNGNFSTVPKDGNLPKKLCFRLST